MSTPDNTSKRRRLNPENGTAKDGQNGVHKAKTTDCPFDAPTFEEKSAWRGFCEIESEPALFNVMLRDFGVKGVKVQEVFGLDEELLAMLPKPVFGLIFLYRYRTDDSNKQEATCPDNVWFANQISDFSCATVSLLNIINNVPGIELGEHLQNFKDFTKEFPPALKGDAISNFEFVKQIHNSFARKMDMLNIDLGLQNSYDDRRKPKVSTKKSPSKPKSAKKKKETIIEEDDWEANDAAFHFSAYVPIGGDVWKLDGLDRQPQRLAKIGKGKNWLSVITPILETQMNNYAAGEIEFSLLSLVQDPLVELRVDLASNIKSVRAIEAQLDQINKDWRTRSQDSNGPDAGVLIGPDPMLQITDDLIDEAHLHASTKELLARGDNNSKLLDARSGLIDSQRRIRSNVLDEVTSAADDERKAKERRHDYSSFLYTWLSMLAQKEGLLPELIESIGK